jgi:membrane-associated phospholipid phosphatase
VLSALLLVLQVDRAALEVAQGLRWGPATFVFLVASAWWVKAPLIVAVGALGDVRARRRVPSTAICGAASAAAASLGAFLLKGLFDRPRPSVADPALVPLVPTPDSPSFPSGHAMTAFAAAAAVGALHPRLRWPLLALATLVALSRVYLEVHYALDVTAGAVLGTGIGLAVVRLVRTLPRALQRPRTAARR